MSRIKLAPFHSAQTDAAVPPDFPALAHRVQGAPIYCHSDMFGSVGAALVAALSLCHSRESGNPENVAVLPKTFFNPVIAGA